MHNELNHKVKCRDIALRCPYIRFALFANFFYICVIDLFVMKKLIIVILLLCVCHAAYTVELKPEESYCALNDIIGKFNCRTSDAGEQVSFWKSIAGQGTVKLTPDNKTDRLFSLQLVVPDTVWIKKRPNKNAKEGKHYRLVRYYDAVATLPGNPKKTDYYTPRRVVAGKQCVIEDAMLSTPDSITVMLADRDGRQLTLGYRTTDGRGFIPMTASPAVDSLLNQEYYKLTLWKKSEHVKDDFTKSTRVKPQVVNGEIIYSQKKGELVATCKLKCENLERNVFTPAKEFDFTPSSNNRLLTVNQYKRICDSHTISYDKSKLRENKILYDPMEAQLPAGVKLFQTFNYTADVTNPRLARARVGGDTVALRYPDTILLSGYINRGRRYYYLGGVLGHPVYVDAAEYNKATGEDFIDELPDADIVDINGSLGLAVSSTLLRSIAQLNKCIEDKAVAISSLSMQGELPDLITLLRISQNKGSYIDLFPTAYRTDRNNMYFNIYNNSTKSIKKIKLDFNGYLDNGKQYIPESYYSPTFSVVYDTEIPADTYIPIFAVDPFIIGRNDITIATAKLVSVTIKYADGTVSHPKPADILLDEEGSAIIDNYFTLTPFMTQK